MAQRYSTAATSLSLPSLLRNTLRPPMLHLTVQLTTSPHLGLHPAVVTWYPRQTDRQTDRQTEERTDSQMHY